MRNILKPKGSTHWVKSQGTEIVIGLILVVIGCMLLWDASDNRGRKMPWPVSGLAPW
jgi:hypothetical protein